MAEKMSELFNLREWLTISESARHLSALLMEAVTQADVLRLAIDRRLRISLRLINTTAAYRGEVVTTGSAGYRKIHDPDTFEEHEKKRCTQISELEYFLEASEQVCWLRGIFDFPMVSDDVSGFEAMCKAEVDGEKDNSSEYFSTIVEDPSGKHYMLSDTPLSEPRTGSPFFIPSDAVVVVRTKSLREFMSSLRTPTVPTDGGYVSDDLSYVKQAAFNFWSGVDKLAKGTHPDNEDVAKWLVAKGLAPTTARVAASIIRPEWAAQGRKPKNE